MKIIVRKRIFSVYFSIWTITLLFFTTSMLAQSPATIERDRASLREGPGSFYDIVTEIPRNQTVTILEEVDGWYKAVYQELNGYLSVQTTKKAPQRSNVFLRMGEQETTLDVSQHAMSAGIKGFGERFTKTFRGDKSFLETALNYQINPRRYKDFKNETYRGINLRRIRRRVSIPKKDVPGYYALAEEGLGLGIASRIATQGLYHDPALTAYINYVGNLIVEASDVYDNTFKFFILDIDNPNAYACPGGIIFITKGMLKLIQSESELALVLAHEIAHVARFHGVIEMEHRKHHIGSDKAFAAMDSYFEEHMPDAIPTETKELIEEMEEEAFRIYETLIEGRLDEYEEEADYLAMIYAVRAGYSPHGLAHLLERMISKGNLSNNEHYTYESNKMRLKKITVNLNKLTIPRNLLTNKERFRRYQNNMKP